MSQTEASAGSDSQGILSSPGQAPPGSPISDKQPVSWASMVKNQKVLTKYDLQVTMHDGLGSVDVPEDVFTDSAPLWEDFLIGKFLAKAPHIAKIHAIVNKIWALGDKAQMIDVFEVNSTTMKFRITNPTTRNRVARRGMWNLADVPVVVSHWSPLEEEAQPEVRSVPLWIHMRNVPMNMFSWKGLSVVSSPVGIPSRLHPETEQCKDFKVAKVFVKADLTKELPKRMKFNFKGKETVVQYSYPWLPSRCSVCTKWGHLEQSCLQKPVEQADKEDHDDSTLVHPNVEVEVAAVPTQQENMQSASITNTTPTPALEGGNSIIGSTPVTKAATEEQAWITVSPGKGGRSPVKNKLEFGQVSILSNSRFSVLGHTEEEGEITETSEKKSEETKPVDLPDTAAGALQSGEPDVAVHKKSDTEAVGVRQSLPRESKHNHKVLNSNVQKTKDQGPSFLNKKNSKKNH